MPKLDNQSVKFFQNQTAEVDSAELSQLIKAIDNGDKAKMISIFQNRDNLSLLANYGSKNETPFEYALSSVKLIEKYDAISKSDLLERKEIASILRKATLAYAEKLGDQSLVERTQKATAGQNSINDIEHQTTHFAM